jgi:carbon monoxide dehydrogenase subunit G
MVKVLATIVVGLVVAALVYAATRPDTFRVHRSASINAPPQKIFPLINDLRRFNTWNPFTQKDPGMKGNYSGPSEGKGAAYAFSGNKNVGEGSIEIAESSPPSKITMKLDMIRPFEAHNIVEFTLEPNGHSTSVTWAMHGRSPYLARLMSAFVSMDSMIGKEFEAGLASLKSVAES